MKKTILLSLFNLAITSTSCTSDNDFDTGKKQLEQYGYTDIENTGLKYFCSPRQIYRTGFKCKNKKGETVEGCFSSDLFGGITIRFE